MCDQNELTKSEIAIKYAKENGIPVKDLKLTVLLDYLDYSQIEDVELDGIDGRDAPDFSDAYISSATYKGREMTEDELNVLNANSEYVYQKVIDWIY